MNARAQPQAHANLTPPNSPPSQCNRTMAVRSRSSLQVRQDPDLTLLPPPPKRRRLLQQPVNPASRSSTRRRGSSPDLLDTMIEPSSPKPLSLRPANSPLSTAAAPPSRASTRRLLSSASSTTYNHPPPSPPPSNDPKTPSLKQRQHTLTVTPATDPIRESPDPLDTISPAPAVSSPRTRPSPAVRETRQQHNNHKQKNNQHKIENNTTTQNSTASAKTPRTNIGRSSRRNNSIQSAESQPPPPSSSAASPVRERRSLRSHDTGTRLRSELTSYFPNYEQLLSLEPQKTEFLTGDTTIQLVDDLIKPPSSCLPPDSDFSFGNPLLQFHNCEVIQLSGPKRDRGDGKDPLNEETYFRAHRRIERQEKQLRNIERERAQHEKLQVDRLLDELRGHDWLRVMGITGVADNAKKLYEPKRDFCIRELTALIDKFKLWKEEEKRRKLAKDQPSMTSPDAPEHDADDNHGEQSTEEVSDANDVDAQAARQLHREARSATGKKPKQTYSEKRRKSKPTPTTAGQEQSPQEAKPPPQPLLQPLPETYPCIENKPFTSSFVSPELRAMALGNASSSENNRKTPRHHVTLAFGHPIPDMKEQEFQLPPDILTDEAILASQRKQRRMRREGRKG